MTVQQPACYGLSWSSACKDLQWKDEQRQDRRGCPQFQNCNVETAKRAVGQAAQPPPAQQNLVPPQNLTQQRFAPPPAGLPVPPQPATPLPAGYRPYPPPAPPPQPMQQQQQFDPPPQVQPGYQQHVQPPPPGMMQPVAGNGYPMYVQTMSVSPGAHTPSPLAVQEDDNPAVPPMVRLWRTLVRSALKGMCDGGSWFISYNPLTPHAPWKQQQYMQSVYPGYQQPPQQ